jgi:hypothetical protein
MQTKTGAHKDLENLESSYKTMQPIWKLVSLFVKLLSVELPYDPDILF